MPLTESHMNTVVFVCDRDTDQSIQPIGTAFVVAVPGANESRWRYLVTAAHVVRDRPKTWVRFRRMEGPPVDIPAGKWVPHARCDIAATPLEADELPAGVIGTYIETGSFSDVWPEPGMNITPGHRVSFMGLLTHVESMVERNIPMMRAGSIGALWQEDIPVRDELPDRTVYVRDEPIAHLIDTYSRRGFSGAPLYIEYPNPMPQAFDEKFFWGWAALLGIIVGHFGSPADNAGVAVAVPSEAIRELVENNPELVKWRNGKEAEMETKRDKRKLDDAAQIDSVDDSAPTEETEFGRFETLARKLVHTPKTKPDKSDGEAAR